MDFNMKIYTCTLTTHRYNILYVIHLINIYCLHLTRRKFDIRAKYKLGLSFL